MTSDLAIGTPAWPGRSSRRSVFQPHLAQFSTEGIHTCGLDLFMAGPCGTKSPIQPLSGQCCLCCILDPCRCTAPMGVLGSLVLIFGPGHLAIQSDSSPGYGACCWFGGPGLSRARDPLPSALRMPGPRPGMMSIGARPDVGCAGGRCAPEVGRSARIWPLGFGRSAQKKTWWPADSRGSWLGPGCASRAQVRICSRGRFACRVHSSRKRTRVRGGLATVVGNPAAATSNKN